MSPHDNGPRDGDFVRYIDELTARVAAKSTMQAPATSVPKPTTTSRTPATTQRSAPVPPAVKPPQTLLTFPPGSLGIGALFTVILFVVGGLLLVAGLIAQGLDILIALGFGLVAWAVRRTADARKVRA